MLKTAYKVLTDAGIEISDVNYDACMSIGWKWDADISVEDAKAEIAKQYPEVTFDEPEAEEVVEESTEEVEEVIEDDDSTDDA